MSFVIGSIHALGALPNSQGWMMTQYPSRGGMKSGGHWWATCTSGAPDNGFSQRDCKTDDNGMRVPGGLGKCAGKSDSSWPRSASRAQISRLTNAKECMASCEPAQTIRIGVRSVATDGV